MYRCLLSLLTGALLTSCASSLHGDTTPPTATRTPEQLTAFLQAHEPAITAGNKETLARLDALCAQHDCRSSLLFWFTDLEEAKARARRENKPILSLRLLGKLTDPQSCANSRFFRSVLYADPAIAKLLRERFILHWKEVRPVPKVTIDFGDGRTLHRTLTGNSAHYVLDADGKPLDALTGLVSPRAFRDTLVQGLELATRLAMVQESERKAALTAWHDNRARALVERWARLLRERGVRSTPKLPDDAEAALGILNEVTRGVGYARIAEPAVLAVEVEHRISARFPDAWRANEVTTAKAILESPVLRGLRHIRETIGRDSIENELWHRGRIHTWFIRGAAYPADAIALDYRVYAELFLSPLDDPWYGLMPPDEMRALDDCVTVQRDL